MISIEIVSNTFTGNIPVVISQEVIDRLEFTNRVMSVTGCNFYSGNYDPIEYIKSFYRVLECNKNSKGVIVKNMNICLKKEDSFSLFLMGIIRATETQHV